MPDVTSQVEASGGEWTHVIRDAYLKQAREIIKEHLKTTGKPVSEGGAGYSCIAEIRMIETINDGAAKTPFMSAGDTVRMEMLDAGGHSIFGAIEQEVVAV